MLTHMVNNYLMIINVVMPTLLMGLPTPITPRVLRTREGYRRKLSDLGTSVLIIDYMLSRQC